MKPFSLFGKIWTRLSTLKNLELLEARYSDYTIPNDWTLAATLAYDLRLSGFHEAGHVIAYQKCGCNVNGASVFVNSSKGDWTEHNSVIGRTIHGAPRTKFDAAVCGWAGVIAENLAYLEGQSLQNWRRIRSRELFDGYAEAVADEASNELSPSDFSGIRSDYDIQLAFDRCVDLILTAYPGVEEVAKSLIRYSAWPKPKRKIQKFWTSQALNREVIRLALLPNLDWNTREQAATAIN